MPIPRGEAHAGWSQERGLAPGRWRRRCREVSTILPLAEGAEEAEDREHGATYDILVGQDDSGTSSKAQSLRPRSSLSSQPTTPLLPT